MPGADARLSRLKTRNHLVFALAALLLATHFALAVGSKFDESTTSDELVHLTAGTSYWRNHDYRLQPENGILPQRWAALPAALSTAKFPPLAGNIYWETSDVWRMGSSFFYHSGQDHFPLLSAGRAMIALFSVATGLLVFSWSRRIFGDAGGLLSLGFFAFSPAFLAHGALVTSDACATFFLLAAAGAWWRHLHDSRARFWWLSAVVLGFAFVAKYSAVLLLPMMVAMALVRAFSAVPLQLAGWNFSTRSGRLGAAAASAIAQGLVAAAIIWAFYGFRYSAFNPALPPALHFIRPWEFMEAHAGLAGQVIHVVSKLRLLPEAFLYGLEYVIVTAASRAAFLNGEYSITGWPSFFLWAFLLKSTVAELLASILLLLRTTLLPFRESEWRSHLYRVTPLLVFFVIYWGASLTSHLNIGHRHLLPIYPVLYIGFGSLGAWLTSRKLVQLAPVLALLAIQVGEAVRISPHFLAYFNFIGGGPERGWRHLVDSSIDWGQDLPEVRDWLARNAPGEPVFLSYFGTGDPAYYGIAAARMPDFNPFNRPAPWYELRPGVYCVSVTNLQQVYGALHGPWRMEWEREYQLERPKEPLFKTYWSDAKVQRELLEQGIAAKFENSWRRYDELRFARLCSYLRLRRPDGNAGHSILIYRLSADELRRATAGPLRELEQLMATAAPTDAR